MNMKINHLPIIAAGLALSLWSCSSSNDFPVAKEPQMLKLSAPILINADSTMIELADYFVQPTRIDSMELDKSLTAAISADSTRMVIKPADRDFPKLSVLKIWSKGFAYSLLLEKSTKLRYRFTFDPKNKKYKHVQIKGQMNEWNASSGYLFEKEGKWHIDFQLFPGKYQYKLILDGKEKSDPGNRDSVSNNNGGYNSLLTLGNLNPSGLTTLFTSAADGRKIVIGVKNKADTVFVFWQNYLLDQKFWKKDSSGIIIEVPRKAKEFDRSFIRVFACNSIGTSNQILVPLQDGKVLTDAKELTRSDREAMIMYFLMVDRFKNGKPENDAPVKDKDIDPKVNYMGGDLAGITKEIEDGYFSNLGINTIWISPITQNPLVGFVEYPAPHRKFSGYHGYWPITLTTVDSRFGNAEELHKLVKEAHSNNINVILDFVSHHVHQDYAVLKAHPDWVTQIDLPGKRKNLRLWDEQRLTTWFDVFLPTFDLTKPEVANMVSDSATFWIKEYKLDGFRHDAAKHVPENYWRMLTQKLTSGVEVPEKRTVFQIGETFGSRELIGSYINPGMLDAQFEFNLYWDAKSSFAFDNTSFRDLNYSLQQSFSYFGEHNLMGNITGNQDMTRFISYAGGALNVNEDEHEAGWKRDIQVKDTLGYHKLASLEAFNMTIPGIPVIYYGDEQGMAGVGDPDNRRMMKFDSLNIHEKSLKEITAKLAHLRNSNLALVYGDFATLRVNEKVFVYLRSYFDKAVVVIFNKDKSSKKIEFDLPERFTDAKVLAQFGNKFTMEKGKVSLELPGNSFEILSN
ncbi:MAG: alpha-amylase family glycosyl hydrolase [Bacteroidetes bacterium]|nr:alpha-amylase family glycosyl hydrolase [Bacteroidota bacterium]